MSSRAAGLLALFTTTLMVAATSVVAAGSDGTGGTRHAPAPRPHLLMISGGGFVVEDTTFKARMRRFAVQAGFVPHFLTPLGDLRSVVREARDYVRMLRSRVGAQRLYVYGTSAGGILAAILAGDGLVRAGVAKAPAPDLLDWEGPLRLYGPDYFEQIGAEPELRRRLSPIRRRMRRPLLVVQGRGDRVVDFRANLAYAAKFRRVKIWLVKGGHQVERRNPRLLNAAMRWLAARAE